MEYNYTPPVHFAVREDHVCVAALLLAHGADPAYGSYPFMESLLTFAEERGHAEPAQLLRWHLSRRLALASGTQAKLSGAEAGNLAAVETEPARDATLAGASNETGDTALHRAAKHGHVHIVRTLPAAGANVDAVRGDGYRPLHCALMPNWFFQEPLGVAARRRQLALAQLLPEYGADPLAAGASWASLLVWAERMGHGHVADVLRNAGANLLRDAGRTQ